MRRLVIISLFCALTGASSAQSFSTLYTFCSQNNCTDGFYPHAALVQGTDGNLYGTTQYGGTGEFGTIFEITLQGALTTFHNFSGPDGSTVLSGLTQTSDGDFYGATYNGGYHDDPSCGFGNIGCGTIYKITPQGTFITLYNFCAEQFCHDGANPLATLVQAKDGSLYGTAAGQEGGTIFRVTPDGKLTTIYHFCSQWGCTDGKWPRDLVQGADGNLYGTTYIGGTSHACDDYFNGLFGCGTVFKVTPGGVLTTLHSFDRADGCYPEAGLVQGSDGNFYGSTGFGGLRGCDKNSGNDTSGTVFKITPTGMLTTLHFFCSLDNCADGRIPFGALIQASDGNFYGTTNGGGTNSEGTLYSITPGGKLTTLYSFCSLENCADGVLPYGALVQASDGNLYGTTYEGGTTGSGTVYRFDAGLFSTLSVANSGGGTVNSTDRHIYCGNTCSHAYANGTQITLSAVPAPGHTLSGWTGCDKVNGSFCLVTLTATKSVTATFSSVSNISLTSLSFKPTYVRGGQLSAGTLTLSGPAPSGGLSVALGSDHPGVAHPPSFVIVPSGKNSVQFAVSTFPVKSNTTVTITATAGVSQVSGTLTVGTTSLPLALR